MKIRVTPTEVLQGAFAFVSARALLDVFQTVLKEHEVSSWENLPNAYKQCMTKSEFEYLTRTETETERIEELFVQYKPKEFGIIKPNEQKFIQDYLGITDDTPEEELIRLRNAIIQVYADNYAERYPDVVTGNDLILYTDKMSAFTYVIDHMRAMRGLEV